MLLPSLWWAGLVYAVGIAGIRVWPEWTLPIFSSTSLVSMGVVALVLWREAKKRKTKP